MYFICCDRTKSRRTVAIMLLLGAVVVSCCGQVKECVNIRPYFSHEVQQLRLKAELSDSVLSLQEVSDYSDSVYREIIKWDLPSGRETGTERLKGPKLTLSIINESGREFMIPRYVYASHGISPDPFGATFDLVGNSLKQGDVSLVGDAEYALPTDCASQFVQLASGESFVISDTIDIFYRFGAESPGAGSYWVRVHFWNYLWLDTLPPVWIGEIWSDTLRFEIVGNR